MTGSFGFRPICFPMQVPKTIHDGKRELSWRCLVTHRLLSTLVVAVVATGCTFSSASACEKNKNSASAASTKSGNTTAAVASAKSTAAVASLDHCLMPTVATTTAGGGTSACATKMSAAECASKMAAGECSAKSSNAVMASSKGAAKGAAASDGCCMSGASTKTASAKSTKSGAKSATASDVDAVLVGGPGCSAHKSANGTMAHADCDNCSDLVMCEGELKTAQASMQVVPLKNGVMYVYTASGAKNVRTVQTAIARHTEKVTAVSAANGAKLCPECKSLRGAAASGKLEREVVNIEGGCLTLVTSNDPAVVNKIYTMAGLPTNTAARVKS